MLVQAPPSAVDDSDDDVAIAEEDEKEESKPTFTLQTFDSDDSSSEDEDDNEKMPDAKVESESPEVVDLSEEKSVPKPASAPVDSDEVLLESIEVDLEKSGFKKVSKKEPLPVSAAAFTNAKAIAYFHQLEGEPSPRNLWHSKNSTAPPLSEKDIALAKIRAFSAKQKKKGTSFN